MKFAGGELQIAAALGTVSVEIQLDKVHKELEPLKDTIEKTIWEAGGRFPAWPVAGAEQEQGMQPGIFITCVGTLGMFSFKNKPGSCRRVSKRK